MRASTRYLIVTSVIGTFAISGCASQGVITDTSCSSFVPIAASTKDTTYTKRQVIKHNAAYDAVCGPYKGEIGESLAQELMSGKPLK